MQWLLCSNDVCNKVLNIFMVSEGSLIRSDNIPGNSFNETE